MKIVNLSYQAHPEQKDPMQWIGGYGFFYNIWEEVGRKHEVIFLEFIGVDTIIRKQHIAFHCQRRSTLALIFPFALHRFIKAQQPDVVVVHGILFPLQVWLLRKALGERVKIIQQHHAEQPFRYMYCLLQKMADKQTDVYWFTAHGLAEPWIRKKLISHPIKVKELMETTSTFHITEREAAQQYTKVAGGKRYLWVGRLNANKDPLLAANAFLDFALQHPEAHLYMIYQKDDLMPQLRVLLEGHPAAAHIHLVGTIPHEALHHWYSSVDFVLSCSHYEGSGVAVCEAMSCGCIPLVTAIPSFRYMTGEACGMLFPPGDQDALAAVLERSVTIDVKAERERVLTQYYSRLSALAIAAQIDTLLGG